MSKSADSGATEETNIMNRRAVTDELHAKLSVTRHDIKISVIQLTMGSHSTHKGDFLPNLTVLLRSNKINVEQSMEMYGFVYERVSHLSHLTTFR